MNRLCVAGVALMITALMAGGLGAETLTLTTYYPAPYGGYVSILTTGNTFLARDAGTVAVGTAGDVATKLTVHGDSKLEDLLILNSANVYVRVPRPPTGKTLAWKSVSVGGSDDYAEFTVASGESKTDTCDSNRKKQYVCPDGIDKTCVDVFGAGTASCANSAWTECSSLNACVSDTCTGGDTVSTYTGCDRTCRDVVRYGGGRSQGFRYRQITYTSAAEKYVNVKCSKTSAQTVTVLVAE